MALTDSQWRDVIERAMTVVLPPAAAAAEWSANMDWLHAVAAGQKHHGPDAHPGTGTPQNVHGGSLRHRAATPPRRFSSRFGGGEPKWRTLPDPDQMIVEMDAMPGLTDRKVPGYDGLLALRVDAGVAPDFLDACVFDVAMLETIQPGLFRNVDHIQLVHGSEVFGEGMDKCYTEGEWQAGYKRIKLWDNYDIITRTNQSEVLLHEAGHSWYDRWQEEASREGKERLATRNTDMPTPWRDAQKLWESGLNNKEDGVNQYTTASFANGREMGSCELFAYLFAASARPPSNPRTRKREEKLLLTVGAFVQVKNLIDKLNAQEAKYR